MRYTVDIEISKDKETVAALFADPANLKHWQPELISADPIDGEPGATGSTCSLKYTMGKATLEMKETILENALPDGFSATYEADKVWNQVDNVFTESSPGQTTWTMVTEFKFHGFMKVIGFLFPGSFKKQTCTSMERFKAFAEAQG